MPGAIGGIQAEKETIIQLKALRGTEATSTFRPCQSWELGHVRC